MFNGSPDESGWDLNDPNSTLENDTTVCACDVKASFIKVREAQFTPGLQMTKTIFAFKSEIAKAPVEVATSSTLASSPCATDLIFHYATLQVSLFEAQHLLNGSSA